LDLSLLTVNTVIAFLLVLFRLAGMLVSAPLFNMRAIPMQAKVGLAVTMALLLFPLHTANLALPKDLIQFAAMAIQETILGLLIGYAAGLVFTALQMAGEYMSMQMGLSVANILDPITQTQTPVIGQFFFYLAALVFLTMNIHHGLIAAVDRSFTWLPLGKFIGDPGVMSASLMTERFIKLTGDMFIMALMIGVPVMGILLVTELALSFVAKVMPQMNIFMVAIPMKVALGLLLIMISLPYLSAMLGDQYSNMVQILLGLYKA